MPSVTYPQHTFSLYGRTFRVPIRFVNPNQQATTDIWYCLLDTGAHTSVIPEFITNEARHDLTNGKEGDPLTAAWGAQEKSYKHTYILELMDPNDQTKVLRRLARSEYDCTAGHNHPEAILGAENFLRYFRLEFDYSKKEVTLHW